MTYQVQPGAPAPSPNQLALDAVERVEVLADRLLGDVRGQNPDYAATVRTINDLYDRLNELRPLIDQLLGGSAQGRWLSIPSTRSGDDGCSMFIIGLIVGAFAVYFLLNQ